MGHMCEDMGQQDYDAWGINKPLGNQFKNRKESLKADLLQD